MRNRSLQAEIAHVFEAHWNGQHNRSTGDIFSQATFVILKKFIVRPIPIKIGNEYIRREENGCKD